MRAKLAILVFSVVVAWTTSGLVQAVEQNEAMGYRHGHNGDSQSISASGSGPQKLCPLTGQPVEKSQFVDYEGKRIYFCCAACKAPFLKDPAKYIQAMESAGVILEKAPER